MKLFFVWLLLLYPVQASAWSLGYVGTDNADKARICCGLIERFGPNRSTTGLSIEIAEPPYGPLTVTMGVGMRIELGASMKHVKQRPPEPKRAETRQWLLQQTPRASRSHAS
jgi:hypothetical protein